MTDKLMDCKELACKPGLILADKVKNTKYILQLSND